MMQVALYMHECCVHACMAHVQHALCMHECMMQVDRILEKVVRCYKGDPTRVLDVCRYRNVHTVHTHTHTHTLYTHSNLHTDVAIVYACLVE